MHIDTFRDYCLAKPGVTEGTPFGPDVLVLKVMNKMFALTGLERMPWGINLKCDPERAIELREQYESVQPGYHMNKQHWNTIHPEEGELSDKQLTELIDHSYELVVASLSKKLREELAEL